MGNENSGQMKDDIRDIRNDIERIKSSVHNTNRIMTLSNVDIIINDLKSIIGRSKKQAAILFLTKEKISAQDLSDKLLLDRRNLPRYIAPFTDKKAYVTVLKDGSTVYYQRAEIIDLINFEEQEAFSSLIQSWIKKQSEKSETSLVESKSSETEVE